MDMTDGVTTTMYGHMQAMVYYGFNPYGCKHWPCPLPQEYGELSEDE